MVGRHREYRDASAGGFVIDSPSPQRDQLAIDAEAYEDALRPGSTVDTTFDSMHPGIAKTVRMLNAVFRPELAATLTDATQAHQGLSQIGRFAVERCLGSGNFGSVWLGYDPLLKRNVAIKVAHIGTHARADLQERFEREGHLAARLHHPNIVPVFETGTDDGRLFIVSEFCEGQNLAEWLTQQNDQIEPYDAAELLRQLADAVDHAHRQGLIHRDIKPANVLLVTANEGDSAPAPRLTDFGLARDLAEGSSFTRTGVLVGTTEYMSPEQASGNVGGQGPGSDIFSLGVVLYRIVTGVTPFSGSTDFDTIRQILDSEPVAPARQRSEVPRDLSSICLKCLEKQPERRYKTAADLRDDLDRFLRGEATSARPITSIERLARWAKRAPAAAALVLATITFLIVTIVGMGIHLGQVEQHAQELAGALEDTRIEREAASAARDEAMAAELTANRQRDFAETQRQHARQTSYRSDMRLAFDLWERGQVHQVREILERQMPSVDTVGTPDPEVEIIDGDRVFSNVDLRGVEWFALAADFRAKYRELGYHKGGATECVVSSDATRAYSTGVDGAVRVWDVASGKSLGIFEPHIGEIHALALSPDQSTLAVGGQTWLLDLARVVFLNSTTGERLQTWQVHKTTIESVAFSPDGKWLAAGSRYEPVQLTRLTDGTTFTLPANRRNRSVSFSSDSRFLSIAANTTSFAVYQIAGSEPVLLCEVGAFEGATPYVSCYAPNVSLLANGCQNNGYVSLVEPSASPVARAIAVRDAGSNGAFRITCLGFSPNAQLLAAGGDAGRILTWKPNAEELVNNDIRWQTSSRRVKPVASWTPHESGVTSIVASNDSTLITSGEDGRVALTSPFATGVSHIKWRGIHVNDFSLDGCEIVLACDDGTVRQHAINGSIIHHSTANNLQSHESDIPHVVLTLPNPISSLALSPDGKLIAVGTLQGGVRLYHRDSGTSFRTVVEGKADAVDAAITDLAFSADGAQLAYTGDNRYVYVLDIASGAERLSLPIIGAGSAVTFLNGNQRVACGGTFEGIRLVDVSTGKSLQTITGDDTYCLSVSPNGRWLASSHANGTVRMFDTYERTSPRVISGHRTRVLCTAFSPDSRTLISLDGHGVVQFVSVESGGAFGRLKLSDYGATDFGYSQIQCSDQLLVVTGYSEHTGSDLYYWHIGDAESAQKQQLAEE